MTRTAPAALASLLLLACAHFPINEPLGQTDPAHGYRVSATSGDTDDSQQLLLIVNFSGGGTRAAAFAYGALLALRDARVRFDGRERSLADEIDILASVSGGSFTAAYFALNGARFFDDFEAQVLRRDIQGALFWRFLAPWNWVRLGSPYFGRSDLAAEYYDEQLFHGATLGDLLQGDGPALLINATDMTLSARFTFDQEQFDLLCSDTMRFPIARAVAASSAVPLALSPVTLVNYAARGCGEPPNWVREEIGRGYSSSRLHQEALRIAEYRAAPAESYVHLLDGALADNLGLRSTIEKSIEAGGYGRLTERAGFTRFRRVAFLVINAQTESIREWTRSASPPSTLDVLTSASTVTLNRYNYETVDLFRQSLDRLVAEIRESRCRARANAPGCDDVAAHLIEISFAQHSDPAERTYLNELPTTLALSTEQLDRTIDAARTILTASPEFQGMLRDLAQLPETHQQGERP
jgi:NTE family protein